MSDHSPRKVIPTHLDMLSLALEDVGYEGHQVGGVGGVLGKSEESARSSYNQIDVSSLLRYNRKSERRSGWCSEATWSTSRGRRRSCERCASAEVTEDQQNEQHIQISQDLLAHPLCSSICSRRTNERRFLEEEFGSNSQGLVIPLLAPA